MFVHLHLLWRHLWQYPGRLLFGWGTMLLASVALLLLSHGAALLHWRLGPQLEAWYPREQVVLEPALNALGPLAFERGKLDANRIDEIRDLPVVESVWPVYTLKVPTIAVGTIFGQELSTDVVVHGVTREMVSDGLDDTTAWGLPHDPEAPYPVVIAQQWLDLYNLGYARAHGFPLLNPQMVIGQDFDLIFGASNLTGMGRGQAMVHCEVVGLTRKPGVHALAMPVEAIEYFHKHYGEDNESAISQVMVQLKPTASREAFVQTVGEWGLHSTQSSQLGERLKQLVTGAGYALAGLAVMVLGLGLLVFYAMLAMTLHARRDDLFKLRALGLGPVAMVALGLGEIVITVLAAQAVALGIVPLLLSQAGGWVSGWTQALPLDLSTWASPYFGLWVLVMTLALFLSLLPVTPVLIAWARSAPGNHLRDL